jgi:putative tricarboxylic transport membrane protein
MIERSLLERREIMKRILFGIVCLACAFLLFGILPSSGSAAEKFPTKTIEVVNQFGAGGGTDIYVRTLTIPARRKLKVPIVINNLTGGGGVRAESYVLSQPADGYTLFAIGPEQIINTVFERGDITKFTPIIRSQHDQSMLHVNPEKSKFETIQEIVDFAKKNPGALKIAVTGAAGFDETVVGLFAMRAGIKLTRIPFDGAQESLSALLGGHVDLLHEEPGVVMSLIEARKIKPVVVFTEKRLEKFPDVPTAKELGWNVTLGRWRGMAAPKGTPKERIQILHEAFKKAMSDTKVYQRVVRGQLLHLRPGYLGPEDYAEFLDEELKTYTSVLTELGLIKK